MASRRSYDSRVFTAALLIGLFVQAPPAKKVEIVSVTGCLREQGASNWMLVAATDPVPSVGNQAQGDDIPKTPPAGKNSFRLIGVSEFNFPQHRDRLPGVHLERPAAHQHDRRPQQPDVQERILRDGSHRP